MKLKEICEYISDRVAVTAVSEENYISTENMAQNKGGVTRSSSIPTSGAVIRYKNDDILISNIRPYFKKIWQADKTGGCSADVLCIRAKEHIDSTFLYYLLSQDAFFEYVMMGAKGCKMPRGDKGHIMDWEIDIPEDKSEQTAIGQCLKVIDKKIEINRQINDNLEQQAQTLYKSWFVDFEPFKDGAFKESECGLIPEGWRVGSLSDLTEITMGQSPSGKSYNETGDGMLFYQGRAEFGDRYPSIRLYTTEPSRIAEQNSVLLSVRAPVGDTNIAYNKCCIGRGLASITAKHGFNSFIFYMIKSLKDQFDLYNGEGTVFGSINRDSLNSMKVIVPTNEVINDFEKIVAPLDFKYKSLFTENLLLTQQRDTLLPKLMSGELKINEIDC